MEVETQSVLFTLNDRYIVGSSYGAIIIWNAQTYEQGHEYKGYNFWTQLRDGTCYALGAEDGWLYRFTGFDVPGQKLVWIPPLYQPQLYYDCFSGPLFTSSSKGVQYCLARRDSLVTHLIPHNFH
jgi:hypothetical protein